MSEPRREVESPPRPDPASPAPAAHPGSRGRAARIWRRTWVGTALSAVVAAVLAGAWHSETGTVVLVAGAVTMAACLAEVARLGSHAGRGLSPALQVAGAAVVAALAREVLEPARALPLAWRYLEAGSLALLAAGLGAHLPARARAAAGVALAGLVSAVHLLAPSELDPRVPVWGALAGAVLACAPRLRSPEARRHLALVALLALWLVPPLPGMLHVWRTDFGAAGLIALVLLSKVGDIFGYYVGNALGRTHPFPRLSPGKTTAGCVGSLLGAVVAGGALVALGALPAGGLGIAGGLLAGLVVNVAAQAGDLLESAFKRSAGVKDSGVWFGPSGGMLDLCDSLLLTIPVALLTWPWILGGP